MLLCLNCSGLRSTFIFQGGTFIAYYIVRGLNDENIFSGNIFCLLGLCDTLGGYRILFSPGEQEFPFKVSI